MLRSSSRSLIVTRILRPMVLCGIAIGVQACGGSGGGTPINGPNGCNPGTQVQLASPLPGQAGVSTGIGNIIIVANDNNNFLGTSFGQFGLNVVSPNGATLNTSSLTPVPFQNGPHPFPRDFYYSGNLQGLGAGLNYSVFLNQFTTNCNPLFIGTFST